MPGKTLPEPPGLPVVGHTLRWMQDPFAMGAWIHETAGGVAKIKLLNKELVVVTDPEPIQNVLIDERESFPKSEQYERAFGPGLASVSGRQWRRQRDVITEFFRPRRIDSYTDTIVSVVESRTDTWTAGETIDLFEEMKLLTLEVLFETVFDYSIDPDGADEDIRQAVDDLDKWFKPTSWVLPEWVPTPARRQFREASDRLDTIADELLADTEDSGDGLLRTLQALNRQADAPLDADEIRSQVQTFLFAGHETTASTLAFALQLLGEHHEIESRFHTELDSTVRDGGVEATDLEALAVTDGLVRETLRLYPAPFRIPRVAAEDVELGGCSIEAGTDVLVYTVVPHRDDRFWTAPMEFRPGRWEDIDPEATGCEYIPFGAGPRACIGRRLALLEMRLALATIGKTYRLEPQSDLDISARVAATPEGQLPVRVHRR
jgi:cytochrome P450